MRRHVSGFLAAVVALAACGGDDSASTTEVSTEMSLVPATAGTADTVPVPEVELPDELPTELVVTELQPGDGVAAAVGDTVIVNYVGVRSADGTQFDSNFGSDPFPVVLGSGGVIPGWEQGLEGSKGGQRMQLDIPSDLAYGDQPRGDVIQAGDALSFVIDVLAVVPATDEADAPTDVSLPVTSTRLTEVVIDEVRPGDGRAIDVGMTAVAHLVAARADNGTVLQSTWSNGDPQAVIVARGQMLDGLVEGLVGMKVGARRVISIPAELAFGAEGMPSMGLPADTDIIVIADLLAAF